MKRILYGAVLALTACASAGGQAPASNPVVTIRNYPAADAIAKVSTGCVTGGGQLEQITAQQVVCARPMDGSMRSMLLRALATPSYSTNPVYRIRFSAIEYGGSTTLSANMWAEYQNAYGQTTQIPITNRQELANAQAQLDRFKAEWESTH